MMFFNVQFMFRIYLVLFHMYFIGSAFASANCRQAEYRVGEDCCPACPAGMYVTKHCTKYVSTSCKPCKEGTYQDNVNGRERCYSCSTVDCNAGLGLKVKKVCTPTSDALCENLDGYFCIDYNRGGCIAAQRHMVCSPGQYISQRGTADKDTECLQCTDGSFSDGTSSSCQPHTKCESVGLKQIQPGSDSTDSECGGHHVYTGLVAGIIPALILVMLAIISAIIFTQRKKISANCRRTEYRVGEDCCPACPAGMYVKQHCTEFTGTSCRPCTEGTYQDNVNGREQCYLCTNCNAETTQMHIHLLFLKFLSSKTSSDNLLILSGFSAWWLTGLGLKVKKVCTSTSDALCENLDGYFCIDSNKVGCIAAQKHMVCSPGQYISQRGTADKDTECLQCTDGTFSNGTSSSCQPHTKCESMGLKQIQPGSDSTDSECGKHDVNTRLVPGIIPGLILVMLAIISAIILTVKRKKISAQPHNTAAINIC
ncbi:Tumor necrosis factor receptor superfamily member 14 [Merluccius polli]|uniref:Tumor necrosis factor receptor superfamily member 14 n=1 Tax=Merluccius polli TaxID=89951 RepID=A0AA47MVR7_MERPO|nr:Tumor necrosis factor receptor superfamily member 14 [Merluccius polli]